MLASVTKISAMLGADEGQRVPNEILLFPGDLAAIVVDLDGVDYILTVQRVPCQRPRPPVN